MTAIVDTNVLLSAAYRDRLPERVVLFVATRDDWDWVVTPQILEEYRRVLARPKFGLSPESQRAWVALVESRSLTLDAQPLPAVELPRDPRDEPFLAAALACGADFLITGDRDLLDAPHPPATRVVTAAEFASLFGIA